MVRPDVGDIVLYRNGDGVDMPAVVTAHADDDREHLYPFPPPGEATGSLSYQWGTARAADPEHPEPGTWRMRP